MVQKISILKAKWLMLIGEAGDHPKDGPLDSANTSIEMIPDSSTMTIQSKYCRKMKDETKP